MVCLSFFFSSRRRHTRFDCDWSSDVCSSDLYAIACCAVAARHHPSPDQRRAWVWIGAGCVLFLAGQLVWSYYELIRRVSPPYPSLADVGFLGVYVCFLVAVTKLVGAAPRRRFDYELLIDTVLVT